MLSIWKYPLKVTESQGVEIRGLVEFLSVQLQDGKPTLWALVYPSGQELCYQIQMYGTGWDMPDASYKHLGTVQGAGGLVWHYFY